MLFLDANAIIYYLRDVKPYSKDSRGHGLSRGRALHEPTGYSTRLPALVRMKAWRDLGIKHIEDLRDHIRIHGYKQFEEEIGKVHGFIKEVGITVLEDKI